MLNHSPRALLEFDAIAYTSGGVKGLPLEGEGIFVEFAAIDQIVIRIRYTNECA
jgi:hypothetical protein